MRGEDFGPQLFKNVHPKMAKTSQEKMLQETVDSYVSAITHSTRTLCRGDKPLVWSYYHRNNCPMRQCYRIC
jgi:hypothetical protein